MQVEYSVIIAYIVGIILLYIFGKLFLVPVKILLKLVYNAVVGGIVLLIINYIGGMFGFHIALNIATALTVGILGVPGILLLVILKYVFGV